MRRPPSSKKKQPVMVIGSATPAKGLPGRAYLVRRPNRSPAAMRRHPTAIMHRHVVIRGRRMAGASSLRNDKGHYRITLCAFLPRQGPSAKPQLWFRAYSYPRPREVTSHQAAEHGDEQLRYSEGDRTHDEQVW